MEIYICEDSIEGVFTGIYKAYENKVNHEECMLRVSEPVNYQLFASYTTIPCEEELAHKVSKTICEKFGLQTYTNICQAMATEDEGKADAVYHTVVLGLRQKNRNIMDHLTDIHVRTVFELSRYTGNEVHQMLEFVRFQELENGLLFSRIGPKTNLITFLASHFSDRLPLENFVIYDEKRDLSIVHPAGREWFVVRGQSIERDMMRAFSEKEEMYQKLFRHFCEAITIDGRRNPKLQTQMLPLRFREYMVDFN